ncbi:longitudinals lacking protein-like [Amblyomma americanum]
MASQQFCVKWNSHHSNMLAAFEQLLSNEALVDVTLACEGLSLKAHKIVLSACSPFFQAIFVENPCKHPIVILQDMRYVDLKAVVDFMYRGEVNVSQDHIAAFLKTAETLKVKIFTEVANENKNGAPVTSVDGNGCRVDGDDADFDVEHLNVAEQSMTTENVPVFPYVASSPQALGDESQQSHHTVSTSDNSALVLAHP